MASGRFALEFALGTLSSARRFTPDVIVAGNQLRDLNGLQLTRELRRADRVRRVPIGFLGCGAHDCLMRDRAEAAGCDYFISSATSHSPIAHALESLANQALTARVYAELERRWLRHRLTPVMLSDNVV